MVSSSRILLRLGSTLVLGLVLGLVGCPPSAPPPTPAPPSPPAPIEAEGEQQPPSPPLSPTKSEALPLFTRSYEKVNWGRITGLPGVPLLVLLPRRELRLVAHRSEESGISLGPGYWLGYEDDSRRRILYLPVGAPGAILLRDLSSADEQLALDLPKLGLPRDDLRVVISRNGTRAALWNQSPSPDRPAEVMILSLPEARVLARLKLEQSERVSCVLFVPDGILVSRFTGSPRRHGVNRWSVPPDAPPARHWVAETLLGKPEVMVADLVRGRFVLALGSFLELHKLSTGGLLRQLRRQKSPEHERQLDCGHSAWMQVKGLMAGGDGFLYSFALSKSGPNSVELGRWNLGRDGEGTDGTLLPPRTYKTGRPSFDVYRAEGRTYLLLTLGRELELWDAETLFSRTDWPPE